MTATYEERRAQVLALKAQRMPDLQIAEVLGLSVGHIKRLSRPPETYEKQLLLAREAKRRRTGTCEDCGAETRYAGGRRGDVISRHCSSCASKQRSGLTRRGTGPLQARVLEFVGDGERHWEEIRVAVGMTKQLAGPTIHRMLRNGLLERPRRGVYRKAAA